MGKTPFDYLPVYSVYFPFISYSVKYQILYMLYLIM